MGYPWAAHGQSMKCLWADRGLAVGVSAKLLVVWEVALVTGTLDAWTRRASYCMLTWLLTDLFLRRERVCHDNRERLNEIFVPKTE